MDVDEEKEMEEEKEDVQSHPDVEDVTVDRVRSEWQHNHDDCLSFLFRLSPSERASDRPMDPMGLAWDSEPQ